MFLSGNSAAACTDLKAYLPFNGSSIQDYSGCGQTVTSNGNVTTGVTGQYGSAFSFDGQDDYINVSTLGYGKKGTLFFWIKPNNSAGTVRENYFSADSSDDFLTLQNWDDGNSYWGFNVGGTNYRFTKSNAFPTGYFSVAFRWDDANGSYDLFWNGNNVNSASDLPALTTPNNPIILMAGINGASGSMLASGEMDEFRYYNDFLTNTEIQNLNNTNSLTGGNSPPTLSNFDPANNSQNVNDTLDSTPIDLNLSVNYSDADNDPGNVTFKWQNGTVIQTITSVSSGSTASTTLNNLASGTTYNWQLEATDGEESTTAGNFSFTTEDEIVEGVGYWDFNEGSGSTLNDQWGSPNNGNISSMTYSSDTPNYNISGDGGSFSGSFDGSDGVDISGLTEVCSQDCSISYWMKTSTTGNNYHGLGHKGGNSNVNVLRDDGSGNFEFWMQDSSGNKLNGGTGSLEFTNQPAGNGWVQIAFTYDYSAGEFKGYYNGELDVSKTNTSMDDLSPSGTVWEFGATGFTNYQGNIDEVKFYNQTLQSNEINEIYNYGDVGLGEASKNPTTDAFNILSPNEGSSYNTIRTDFNYTYNSSLVNNSCWVDINSANGDYNNQTVNCGQNVTGLISEVGSSTWRVYGNDTNGNQYSSSVTFTTEDSNPNDYTEIDPHYWQVDPWSQMNFNTSSNPSTIRENATQFLFLQDSLPNDIPDNVNTNVGVSAIPNLASSDVSNVGSVDEYVVNEENNLQSHQYHIKTPSGNDTGRVMYYISGHGSSAQFNYETTDEFINRTLWRGHDVVLMCMPLYCDNTGLGGSNDHSDFLNEENNTYRPLKHFVTQQVRVTNYLENNYNYESIYASGLSGGGQMALMHGALDTRVDKTFQVAGSLPIYQDLYGPDARTAADYERNNNTGQTQTYWNNVATFMDHYLLAGQGQGREHYQINNQNDSCCFWGQRPATYSDYGKDLWHTVNDMLGNVSSSGKFEVYLDDSHSSHRVGSDGQTFIFNNINNSEAVDTTPPSLTIDSPVDGQTYSSSEVDLNVTSDEAVDTWQYSLDGGSNTTFTPNTTISGLSDGSHTVNVYANDSNGNTGSESVSFTVDATPPSISYTSGTTEAGLKTGQDWIFINVSASDNINLDSVTQEFNGVNSSFANSGGGYYWENHTNLQDGNYTVNAYASDDVQTAAAGSREIETDQPLPAFNQFQIDTESEWKQGSFVDLVSRSGVLKLGWGGTDGENEVIYYRNGNLYSFDDGNSSLITDQVSGVGSTQKIGDAVDLDSDSVKEIPFINSNNDLEYYDLEDKQISDTQVNALAITGSEDISNDGDQDLIIETTNNKMGYFDIGSKSVTETSVDVSRLGFPGDVDGDGNIEVATSHDPGAVQYNDLTYYHFEDGSTDTYGIESLEAVSGFADIDSDGSGKETVFDSDIDGDGTNGLSWHTLNDDSNQKEKSVSVNSVSEIDDYDNDGNLELVYENRDNMKSYDFQTLSSTTLVPDDFYDLNLGGISDTDYKNTGSYTSQVIGYEKNQEWNNLTVSGLSRPGSSSVDITFETSSDGFSTINESITISDSELSDGTGNYSLSGLSNATKDARIKIDYQRGSTPEIDALEVYSETENQPPSIPQQDLEWTGLGGSESRNLIYTLSDPDGDDIFSRNSPPSGSVTEFTNSTYALTGFDDVFDYAAQVTDTRGQPGSINSNFTLEKTHDFYTEDNDYVNTESDQKVNASVEVDIRGDSSIYSISAVNPANTKQVVTNGNTSTGSSTTGAVSTSWEWIIDQIQTQTYSTEKDSSQTSTIDTQHVVRKKEVENTGGTTYSQLEVEPVSPSLGTCSNCDTRNISINGNTKKNVSFNSSGDFLEDEKEFEFTPGTDSVTLGVNYIGNRNLQINETAGFDWDGINTTQTVTEPASCSQNNASTVDVPANQFSNYSVEFSCNPGSIGNPTEKINNISTNEERVWYNSTDMSIASNETEETQIAIRADKTNLKNPDGRDGGSLTAFVEGTSSDQTDELNVTDTGGFFRITVGTGFQQSSLHTDDSDWSVTYTLSEEATEEPSGGGGGTAPGTTERTVYFGGDQDESEKEYSVPFGTTADRSLTIENTVKRELTVNLAPGSDPICEYITVRTSFSSDEFGELGTYQMSEGVERFGSVTATNDTTLRFSLPEKAELRDQGIEDMKCEFETSSSYGQAEDLVVVVDEDTTLIDWLIQLFNGLGFDEELSFTVPVADASAISGGEVEEKEVTVSVGAVVAAVFVILVAVVGYFYRRSK